MKSALSCLPLSGVMGTCVHRAKKRFALQQPITRQTAAIWAAYLYQGLLNSDTNQHSHKAILRAYEEGELALVTEANQYLPQLWELLGQYWEPIGDTQGIFEAEVIVPFGHYLGDYLLNHEGQLPEEEEAAAIMRQLLEAFYEPQPQPEQEDPDTTGK